MLRRLLPLVLLVGAGCHTAVGNYFANRGRDFGECWRVQAGGGLGLGASASVLGLADTCAGAAAVPRALGLGWVYGEPYAFTAGRTGHTWDCEVGWSVLPVGLAAAVVGAATYSVTVAPAAEPPAPGTPRVFAGVSLAAPPRGGVAAREAPGGIHWRIDGGAGWRDLARERAAHWCYGFAPAALARVRVGTDPPAWLWSQDALSRARHAHVHAFDVEAAVYAGVIHIRAGFSPGEFVDFFLGWFGLDVAGDDTPARSRDD